MTEALRRMVQYAFDELEIDRIITHNAADWKGQIELSMDPDKARRYRDYRVMLEKRKDIDAVVIGTPDHTHAPPGVMAMKLGKHCYCEKPLTHSVYECRYLTDLARKNKLATQLGTQIHAGDNYRRVVEIIQAGAIGDVTDVHVWVGKGWGGGERPEGGQEPPETLSWDLWLGPAPVLGAVCQTKG